MANDGQTSIIAGWQKEATRGADAATSGRTGTGGGGSRWWLAVGWDAVVVDHRVVDLRVVDLRIVIDLRVVVDLVRGNGREA
jgi:hypothetical protein